jgi:hypothetical protein
MVMFYNSSAALRSFGNRNQVANARSKQCRLGKVVWRHAIVSHNGRVRDWYIWIVVNTESTAARRKRQCSQTKPLDKLSASTVSIAELLTSGSPRQSLKTHSVLIFESAHRAKVLRTRFSKVNMMKAISRSPFLAILKFLDH